MKAARRSEARAQRSSNEGLKAAFDSDTSAWKSAAPALLERIGARQEHRRETAVPMPNSL